MPLAYAGQVSTFTGTLPAPGPGPAAVEVLAMDPGTANFAAARVEVEPAAESAGPAAAGGR